MNTPNALLSTAIAIVLFASAQANGADDVDPSVYTDAIEHPARPDGDRERDAGRRPAEVLAFFGIGPGDRVLEMFAGGGYYTELLSRVVGEDGLVVAHMSEPVLMFTGEAFEARHADNRLSNVDILMAENNELELEANRFDAITLVLNYHDMYWESADAGWALIEPSQFLAELKKGLKPGGTLGIVDHATTPGSPPETGGTEHRIAKDVVIATVENAGFVLEAESDALRNPEDDYSLGVTDPAIRGRTDRFVLRFAKPES